MISARDPEAGLTLIETLITLAIVGVMTGLAALSFAGTGGGRQAGAEAARLVQSLRAASDRAILSGAAVEMTWDEGGYGFRASGAESAGRRPLPDDLRLRAAAPAGGAADPRRGALLIDPDGAGGAASWIIAADRGGDRDGAWAVGFDGVNAAAVRAEGRRP